MSRFKDYMSTELYKIVYDTVNETYEIHIYGIGTFINFKTANESILFAEKKTEDIESKV